MLELNKIHQGDSTSLLKQLPDKSIQLTVTSPPYFAYKDYGQAEENIENFESYEKYVEYFDEWFKELYRVTDEDGRVCIIIDDKHTNLKTEGVNKNRGTHARLILIAEKYGFVYKDLVIWAKARAGHASGGSNLMLGSYPYPPNIPFVNWFEYILIFRKDGSSRVTEISEENKQKSKLIFSEFKWASESIWKIPPERNIDHPAPFPEEIARRLIKLFSFVGETVLDTFSGLGTVPFVSKQLGRNYFGFELNPKYCKATESRLTQSCIDKISPKLF